MTRTTLSLALGLLLTPCAAATARAAEAPKTLVPRASCVSKDCHADFSKKKHLHGPVAEKECKECHSWKDDLHKFALVRKGTALCTECHDDILVKKDGAKTKKGATLHEPITEDCVTCHDPHASNEKGFLTMPLLELCDTCHDKTLARARGKDKTVLSNHAVMLEGKACMTCHSPHTSKVPYLLTQKPKALCLSCHDKPQQAGSREVANVKEQLTQKKHVHGPVADEDCTACHVGHASEQVTLLARAYPPKFYAPFDPKAYALCFECHEADLGTQAKTTKATEFRNGEHNLHFLHVNKPTKGRTCRACHAAHASDLPSQIQPAVPFGTGGWAIPIRFTKTATGGSCQSGCHEPKAYDRKTPVD
ncbi:MAG: hypothetical protein FJ290_07725 [Planctomycetes bacterium]|nr:hypothetical protein [Planctomycetota bacterium]